MSAKMLAHALLCTRVANKGGELLVTKGKQEERGIGLGLDYCSKINVSL